MSTVGHWHRAVDEGLYSTAGHEGRVRDASVRRGAHDARRKCVCAGRGQNPAKRRGRGPAPVKPFPNRKVRTWWRRAARSRPA